MITLQAETHTTLPLEVTTSELFSLSKAPLAQGGTSLVYRGTWLGGGKVAVKKLRVPWGKDELKDLKKEVGVMRQFDHRHVLPLWGYNLEGWEEEGEEQKRPFLVMPWSVSRANNIWPLRVLTWMGLCILACGHQDGERKRLLVPQGWSSCRASSA